MFNLNRFSHQTIIRQTRELKGKYPKKPDFSYNYSIETGQEYSLPYSFLSSYACYLFEPVANKEIVNPFHWKGLIHPFTGLNLIQTSPRTVYLCSNIAFSPTMNEYVQDALGLWNIQIGPSSPEGIAKLEQLYPGVRVPRLLENSLDILIAILCSQHTHVDNGRKWFLFLKKYYRRIFPLLKMDPYEIMRESKRISGGSMGYRARYVHETLLDLANDGAPPEEELRRITENVNVEESRRKLTNIRFVGPKTADCFLLNSLGEVSIPPIDVNVKRVCERLKFIPAGMSLPQLSYCRKYLCDESVEGCAYYEGTKEVLENNSQFYKGCVRAALKIKFRNAGWIQALLFLFGIEFCQARVPICKECSLGKFCDGPQLPIKLGTRIRKRRARNITKSIVLLENSPLLEFHVDEKKRVNMDALKLFEQSTKMRIKGNSNHILAASYWIAARQKGIPLTLKETCYHFDIDGKQLFKAINRIKNGLSISLPILQPQNYVLKIAKKLGLQSKTIKRAKEIATFFKASGHSPIGIAAASILLSACENQRVISLRSISKAAGVTEITVRKNSTVLSRMIKSKNQSVGERDQLRSTFGR